MCPYEICPVARLERLLLATDGSEFSKGAVRESINLAARCGSILYVISVIEVNPEFIAIAPSLVEKMEKEIKEYLDSVKAEASKVGIKCDVIVHEGEEPYKFIIDEAERNSVEMVIMGRKGRTGLKRLMMGSVTARVIGYAPCKVLVVPEDAKIDLQNIMVATDGSRYSEAAVREAISIAKRSSGILTIISVAKKKENLSVASESVDVAKTLAEKEGVRFEALVMQGEPYKTIVETADQKGIGLIVVGSHGRTGIERLLMGSVTERVIGYANCGVLVVKL